MAAVLLLNAAATALPVTPVGWSWSATMGAIQNLILLALGGGGGGLLIRALVQLKRIANERSKQEGDRESARWVELMDYNKSMTTRVEKLEKDLLDERKRCDDELTDARKEHLAEIGDLRKEHNNEIAQMRREHVIEVRALNEKFDALQRMMIQNQLSTAQALSVPSNSPSAAGTIERVGHHLRASTPMGEPE